ncbi:MAG TPA: hypothetical protein VL475_13330 [Planctomycetaceae bacterium]|nr:hypothetical protein [Planctomycetaceae bacterium]
MSKFHAHFRYPTNQPTGDVLYLITVENRDAEEIQWSITLQSASPHVQFHETALVIGNSSDDALQKGLEILGKRHPGIAATEEDLHIGLKQDGSLSGAPFEVLAAMEQFVATEQTDRAREMIAGDPNLWIVALCGGQKKALAVCDYCSAKLKTAENT